ncbi:hypothetical protein [Streptomyces europaeiscabiei]|uniref:Uncharacterized protein n=1 Tax=Streptomyces europaeiscabiei TaxID=146819 RepID=A0ABU4NCF0_9ACTN|nr:hypothetical protein [Streptomyces europaeiscabiei]MDX2760742.1 hypothetical protein [Streptomyces europaeiscabiei]MDX3543364.1 hypothetical protein [Streptomyces europaeiscabiei]MDX3553180.1 hypothetical protein [Streptomyces europaeiscabiei]MDX3700376.1 hypothetical protein [Streptomyces europaeiscabiei]MDX3777298.1 hypothetical protein [Streptomyces europaeiscabiei]
MISINTSFTSTVKMTDRSAVSLCLLGVSNLGTGLSAISGGRPASSVSLAGLPVRERNERPARALEAAVEAQAQAYAFAAAGAGFRKQTTQHHLMWAFRGPEPWSDPA